MYKRLLVRSFHKSNLGKKDWWENLLKGNFYVLFYISLFDFTMGM